MPKKAILAAAVALALGLRAFEAEAQSISGTALPAGGHVVGGQASISQNGTAMRIEQASSRAAIDWQSFNIGTQASVTFEQPSASAIALNRVLGASGSEIFGRLSANGQVFLVNPNGILFGRGAQVDVGGLVASTLGMSPQDFMSGRYLLRGEGTPASIVNQASIRAPRGSVALVSPSIVNDGLIEAQYGAVSLTAANAAIVDFMADGLVQIRVDEGALQAEIANNGVLRADGGSVTLTAKALDSLASAVINNTGIIEARTVENMNGVVRLGGGDVNVSGTIDVSAAEGRGGSVHVLGERVALVGSARLDASGAQGGGEVLVGGDYQGKNPEIQNAKRTYVDPDAIIDASATQSGDGGRVIVWSDERTGFYGTVNARGGAAGGDGGFVEVSSKDTLIYRGFVDVSAASGKAGSVLFDPKNITIANLGTDLLVDKDQFAESPGSSVTFDADQITAITGTGAAVTLQANNDMTVSEDIVTNNLVGTGGALTLEAGRSVFLRANITTDDAPLQIRANRPLLAGVVDNQREPGVAVIDMGAGTTINSGAALTSLIIDNGAGLTNSTSGNITIANIVAGGAQIINNGTTPGSSILRASSSSMITAPEILLELDCGGCAGGGSIGTSAGPMRVTATRLESHIHEAAGGIFIESPNQGLTIGGVSFSGGGVKGVQALTSGDITLSVNGTLTTEAGSPAVTCGAGSGGPICSASGTVTLQANDMALRNSVTAIDGTVVLQPFSTNRDIRIESPSPNVLSLTPAELKLVSASTLKIGRTTDIGKLVVNTAISSADLNAGLLALQHQRVQINAPVDFGAENESLALAHATTGWIDIGASINVGSGQIDAIGQTVNIAGSPVLRSTNSSSGFKAGTLNVGGTGNLSLNAISIVDVLNVSGGTLTVAPGTSATVNGALTNTGMIAVRGNDCCGSATLTVANGFTNDGTIELGNSANGFTGTLAVTAGTLTNAAGHEIRSIGESATATNTLNGRLVNLGTIDVQRSLKITKFPINDGTITLSNNSTLSTNNNSLTNAATGIVQGTGTLDLGAATLTNDGTIRAGTSPGTLNLRGALVLDPTSVIDVEVQSQWATPGMDFDVINVTGSATLDGTLNIIHLDGAAPPAGRQMQVVNSLAVTKTFASVNQPSGSTYTVFYNPVNVTIRHDSTLTPAPPVFSEPVPVTTTTTVSATTGFEPAMVASAGMTSAGATLSSETSSDSSLVALSVQPDVLLPDISHLIGAMSELRKRKVHAVENAARILERDPAAADLPACAGEVSSGCIAQRPAELSARDATDRTVPELAHLSTIERKIALLIGVSEYQDPIPSLGSPLKDIAEIGRLYAEQFGYEVRTLANADKASIVREINRLILETRLNDSVVVFYAGHGHVVEKTGRGYWIPGKAGGEDPTQWISNSDIAKMLANIPARQVLLVSDSCYSGTLTREGKVEKSEVLSDPRAVLERRSVTVLSSGGEEPVADAGKDGHSVFAWHFLRTLGRVAQWSNGVDIYERLAEVVQLDFPQQPQYGAALGAGHEHGADFLFEVRRY